MKNLLLGGVLGFCLAVVLLMVLASGPTTTSRPRLLTDYSRFIADVEEGKVEGVTFRASLGWAHV